MNFFKKSEKILLVLLMFFFFNERFSKQIRLRSDHTEGYALAVE